MQLSGHLEGMSRDLARLNGISDLEWAAANVPAAAPMFEPPSEPVRPA
jgi:hypothetical protein